MMKFLFPLLFLSNIVFAQSSHEEAIILNQELQFLENSAADLRVPGSISEVEIEEKSPEELSLESTYFNDSEKDEIRTRLAAPKRVRGF